MGTHVIAVVGPTATGKSGLAVELALALGGEVVNADSMQLYQGMDIGTAKEPEAAWHGVPHHLLDIWPVTQAANVADYQKLARAAIDEIIARGRVPILAGGSGLYVRAALDDLDFPGTDPGTRDRLEAELDRAGRPGPARPAGPARPGRGHGDPAEQRPPDRARPRGDRDIGPPVHRHHAGLRAEPPGGPDRAHPAPARARPADRRPGRPDVAGGPGSRGQGPGRPGPARRQDRQPRARLPAGPALPGRRVDPGGSPPGDDQGHQAVRPPPGVLVPPRPPRPLARRQAPAPAPEALRHARLHASRGTPVRQLLDVAGERVGGQQPRQQLRLDGQRPEAHRHGDVVLRPVHDLDQRRPPGSRPARSPGSTTRAGRPA